MASNEIDNRHTNGSAVYKMRHTPLFFHILILLALLIMPVNAWCGINVEQYRQIDAQVINPKNTAEYAFRCRVYLMQKQYEKALSDCNRAVEMGNSEFLTYVTRGLVYSEIGEYQKEISDWNRALEISKKELKETRDLGEQKFRIADMVLCYLSRGFAHYMVHEFDKAIDDYGKVIEIKPDGIKELSTAYFYRCLALFAKFQESQSQEQLLDNALSDINKAIALDSENPKFYDSRAKIYLAKKDEAKALVDYQKSEELKKLKK